MNSTYNLPKAFGCLLICVALLHLFVFGLICFLDHAPTEQPVTAESRVLVTAAHLGEIEGYSQLYADDATDFAVHLKEEYTSERVAVGDKVTLVGTDATVTTVSDMEFSVSVNNISKITPGVSGSPVYSGKEPVGFISGWDGTGNLRCIFY